MENKKEPSQKQPPLRKRVGRYHHGNLRQALLQAALQHMSQTSSTEFSLRDITQRAGVSHTSIYRHFQNKYELLTAIAENGFVEFKKRLDQDTEPHQGDPANQLRAQSRAYIRFAAEEPVYYRMMFSEKIDPTQSPKSLNQAAQAAFMSLLSIVLEGVEKKIFIQEDPMEIALALWSSRHGLSLLLINGMLEDAFKIDLNKVDSSADSISHILLNGVLARSD